MQFEVGMLCDGKVTKITEYGAFVVLEAGKSGMIHISEISDGFVKDISQFLNVDDTVRVKVIKIDETGRISLSLKQAASKKSSFAPVEFEKKSSESSSFEDMVTRFMSQSNDKISDLKQRGEQPKRRRRQ